MGCFPFNVADCAGSVRSVVTMTRDSRAVDRTLSLLIVARAGGGIAKRDHRHASSEVVSHAYFLGANDAYMALKTSLKTGIHRDAW